MNKPKFGASRKTSPMLNASETVKLIRLCGALHRRFNSTRAGEVPQRRRRRRPRQAQAADPARARFQDAQDGVRHDQGLRGCARAAQGPSRTLRPSGWHRPRGQVRRARLRLRTVRSDRGHGVATGPLGQRRSTRRTHCLPDHLTPSSGLQQSRRVLCCVLRAQMRRFDYG